jgi:hypothetical protein
VIETPINLSTVPGLSGPDRACLYFVISEGWTCIANDTILRRECRKQGGKVVWGLEMLLKLISAGQITKARAKGIAKRISSINPEITNQLVHDFILKINKLSIK